MRAIIHIFIFFLLFFDCSKDGKISRVEYDIYDTIIDSLYIKDGIPFVLVGDSTGMTLGGSDLLYIELDLKHLIKELTTDEQNILLRNYNNINRNRYKIDVENLNLPIQIYESPMKGRLELLESKTNNLQISDCRDIGIFFFSRAGFNSDSSYALLYYDYQCIGLCGWPAYCLLKRNENEWIIINDYHLGVY